MEFENHKNIYYPQEVITLPIAKEIVKILEGKKISYAQACEALDIAKELTGDLIISEFQHTSMQLSETKNPRSDKRAIIKG